MSARLAKLESRGVAAAKLLVGGRIIAGSTALRPKLMNVATTISLAAAAVETVIGFLVLGFSAAPGWRHFKTFAVIAFSGAAYAIGDTFFAANSINTAILPWVGRLNVAVACIHCASWVYYVRVQYGEPIRGLDRAAMGALAICGALALLPGLVIAGRVVTQTTEWAGVRYQIALPTAFGAGLIAVFPLALLVPVVGYVKKARSGTPGAPTHLFGFLVFFASAVNEALVSIDLIDSLYLADVGFLAAVLSVSAEMTYRATGDARRLQALSAELSRQVEERTRELTETRDNLVRAERLAALGRLSASVGHEINNPLSYVLGNIEFTRRELEREDRNPALIDALRDAASGADRIRKIVHELRVFSRGSDTDRRELVDVREVVDAAVKLVWGELRHCARLERELAETPKVLADPIRLTQVLVNVLMNAVQAIPEQRAGSADSVIRMRSRMLEEDTIAMEITDTGVGISEEDRHRLFEPFFSTKPQDKGTGLGLFISLGIVTSLGGRMEVESEIGLGTLVRIVLPAALGIEPEAERAQSIPPPPLKDRRLLVVDDDVLVAKTLVRLLGNHQVEVVGSGRDALARLYQEGSSYDLVLCDLMMPDLTGMDVYEEIEKSRPMLADRFVFISGGGVTERSRRFIELHADRVLPKPIDSRQLSKVLAQRVGQAPKLVERATV